MGVFMADLISEPSTGTHLDIAATDALARARTALDAMLRAGRGAISLSQRSRRPVSTIGGNERPRVIPGYEETAGLSPPSFWSPRREISLSRNEHISAALTLAALILSSHCGFGSE